MQKNILVQRRLVNIAAFFSLVESLFLSNYFQTNFFAPTQATLNIDASNIVSDAKESKKKKKSSKNKIPSISEMSIKANSPNDQASEQPNFTVGANGEIIFDSENEEKKKKTHFSNIAKGKHSEELSEEEKMWVNALGTELRKCPGGGHTTGAYRDNYCRGPRPGGICVILDEATTKFFAEKTDYYLGDLANADSWCVFTPRFAHAYQLGFRPKIYLEATGIRTLEELMKGAEKKWALTGKNGKPKKGRFKPINLEQLKELAMPYPGQRGQDLEMLM